MAIVGKWSLNGNANAQVGSNGTATNVTWVDGKMNGAGSFNGSSSKIIANLSQVSTFSINFIYKPTNTAIFGGVNEHILTGYTSTNDNFGFTNTHSSPSFYKAFYVCNTSGTFFPCQLSTTPQAGKTYNIHLEVNGNTLKICLDGVLENTTTFTGTIRTNTLLSIGALNGISSWFNGEIDEVIIYNSLLTSAEIKNKYLAYNGFI